MTPSPRVSFQGEPGAFGELTIVHRWQARARAVAAPTFGAAIDHVVRGTTDFAVLPVWNSTIGDVPGAQLALREHDASIEVWDEVMTPVRHALLARAGTSLETVRYVGSHPAALGQCARFLGEHPRIEAVPASDTAGAARELTACGATVVPDAEADTVPARPWYAALPAWTPATLAAVASATVASRYGLVVLADAIQDDPENVTRFVVLRRREVDRW